MLPSLVPPKGRTRLSGNKHWKPSITECRDGLFLHARTPSDIDTVRKEKVNSMYVRGLTVQPYILLVGTSLTNITSTFVVINNHIYKTVSVSDAIDFCFKAYHVLDAKYAFECQHIWQLIQWSVYDINTKADLKIPFIQDLIQ